LAEADARKKAPHEVRMSERDGALASASDSIKATRTTIVSPKERQQ
jgi:hypothetical protein